ncbi:MAG: aspartate kinase [Geminicoccaceae bacterium]|nr:aspartate kinase [Geminicoccaceae bacterium]MCX8101472.1 aspartate kinase [Geminicoccaceae bacterium]MDW8369205.1 aspartate kinase [Geminicoccaceae bacterium]
MALLVQKYGGTSVADLDRIRNVAARIKRSVESGDRLAVVVSAMAGTTNQLVAWVHGIDAAGYDPAEYDQVVASGEQVTIGLLAIALQKIGVPARSFLGWQAGVRTDSGHGKARIVAIDPVPVMSCLERGEVAVVAGFQGIGADGRVTTLGRGGSDTSAVALAAALGAERCDIYTDVDGVYTTDPRIVAKARKLERVTYEEMLEMASVGAKVLETRSVALAMQHRVRVQVLSSFEDKPGTLVVDEDEIVESQIVSGIAYSRNEARITVQQVRDRPGVAAAIFGPLAEANINVDMIVQSVSRDGKFANITFTVSKADLPRAEAVLERVKNELGFERLVTDPDVVKVSVIGVGMRSHAGIAHKMFQTLADKGINIQAISTSEIKISVLIAEEYTELALRALHSAYGLDAS